MIQPAGGPARFASVRVVRTAVLIATLVVAGMTLLVAAAGNQARDDQDQVDRRLSELEAHQAARLALPVAFPRPVGFSPFGEAFKAPRRAGSDPTGLLRLSFGDLDPRDPEDLLRDLPAPLRHAEAERTGLGGRGTLAPGLNCAILSREAIARDGLDAVLARLRADVRVIGYGPDSALLLYVEAARIGRLRHNTDVEFFLALPPAGKMDLQIGRRPLIQKVRASDPDLLLEVMAVPGASPDLKDELRRVPGVRDVADYGPDGSAFLVRAHYSSLPALARVRDVLNIQESLEFMTLNAKSAPTVQVGSAEDGLHMRPFDDAGVDGGGIDTNGDGRRLNNGTDTVPPQIVGVIDNGISLDTPSFSQTATNTFTIANQIGPGHRKIHSIIPVRDNGSDCDSALSGGGSHGNVVAGVIAAYPSQVGAFATRAGIGGASEPRGANLDGVARGTRIIVSDVADSSRCTINSLVEKGGNVDPGSLLARLSEITCPKSGGAGACAGIVGGGLESHLAITPFGAPDNFASFIFQASNGTYPQQSRDLDVFLYNNRDFMVFAPVGNNGARINNNRPELWTP
ncbi:MAG: hypothetical protein HY510_06860, partial [Acidobacteria bacterium]|nr:hypothetical protein [Acidobacteriota bacterium]